MPKVTVIMPVFNAEPYLAQAVNSILAQDFGDFEILVLDDGSTDASLAIARRLADGDRRVVIVRGDHQGVVHWRNQGVAMAKGELIAMMDSDDIALPERLGRQVAFLAQHPDCDAVGAQALRIDPGGRPINIWRVPERHEDIDREHIAGRAGAIINPTVMMRKAAVIESGGYRDGILSAEDYDLFLRLAEMGKLANLPDVLLRYRLHAKSMTCSDTEFQVRMARRALEEAWTRRRMPGALPAPVHEFRTPSEDEQMWSWARNAFTAGHFPTARHLGLTLVRRRPSEFRRWALLGAACAGPLAKHLKRVVGYRVGDYHLQAKIDG